MHREAFIGATWNTSIFSPAVWAMCCYWQLWWSFENKVRKRDWYLWCGYQRKRCSNSSNDELFFLSNSRFFCSPSVLSLILLHSFSWNIFLQNYKEYVGEKSTFRLLNRGSAKALDKVVELDGITVFLFYIPSWLPPLFLYFDFLVCVIVYTLSDPLKLCRKKARGPTSKNNNSWYYEQDDSGLYIALICLLALWFWISEIYSSSSKLIWGFFLFL